MMIVKTSLSLLIIFFSISFCGAEPEAKVASVDFRELQPLLLDLAFADEKNKDLQKAYQTGKERQEKMQQAMQRLMRSGGKEKAGAADFSEIVTQGSSMSQIDIDKKVNNLAKTELIGIIEKLFEEKYELVINRDFSDPILFTEIVISDVTANVRQYLLKQSKAGGEKK